MRTDKLGFLKTRIVYLARDTVKRMKRETADEENIFAKDISDGLKPKIHT